jgi:dolichyl-phosphate beta-glucosyltransferase
MTKEPCNIVVVVPAYNEAARIGRTLKIMKRYLQSQLRVNKIRSEVIVVNDGSKDKTCAVIAKSHPWVHLIPRKANKGKGYSVREGVVEALHIMPEADYIIFTDADGSSHLRYMIPQLKCGKDIIITNRELKESYILNTSKWRRLSSRGFYMLNRILLGLKITDTQNGLKAYSANVARKLFTLAKEDGFCFDAEVLFLATKIGYQVKQVPVVWRNTLDSRVKFKHLFIMFNDTLRILKRYRGGEYAI